MKAIVGLPSRRTPPKRPLRTRLYNDRYLYLILLPGTLFLLTFHYGPMYGILMAFKDFNLRKGILYSPWADQNGMEYFVRLFTNPRFFEVVRNTLVISFGNILLGFWVPIVLAILINEMRDGRYKRYVQTCMYLPHFVSWVIVYGMIYALLSVDGGLVNNVIAALGGDPINFLTNKSGFLPLVYLSGIWKGAGWSTIIYLAALGNINPELYEAAKLDGAGRLQRILHVSLPCMLSTIIVMLILNAGNVMNAGFDQIFNLGNDAVNEIGEIIDTYVYKLSMMKSDYSLATVGGLYKGGINCVVLILVNRLSVKLTGDSIY